MAHERLTKLALPFAAALGSAALSSRYYTRRIRQRDRAIRELEYLSGAAMARADQAKEENKQLRDEMAHDPETGLLNKQGFIAKGNERLKAQPDRTFALAFIDLDNFKAINDNHPNKYDAGDAVLRAVGEVLRESGNRSEDAELLARGSREDADTARLGGDEFAGLFDITPRREAGRTMAPEERAEVLVNRIRQGIRARFEDRPDIQELGGIDASIGFVIREPGEEIQSMLWRGALAMGIEKQRHHGEAGAYRR